MCVFWITYRIPITFLFIFLFANVVFGQPVAYVPALSQKSAACRHIPDSCEGDGTPWEDRQPFDGSLPTSPLKLLCVTHRWGEKNRQVPTFGWNFTFELQQIWLILQIFQKKSNTDLQKHTCRYNRTVFVPGGMMSRKARNENQHPNKSKCNEVQQRSYSAVYHLSRTMAIKLFTAIACAL